MRSNHRQSGGSHLVARVPWCLVNPAGQIVTVVSHGNGRRLVGTTCVILCSVLDDARVVDACH